MEKGQKIVFHTKNRKKRDKIDFSTKLSTLSTQTTEQNVDFFVYKKNKRFVDK